MRLSLQNAQGTGETSAEELNRLQRERQTGRGQNEDRGEVLARSNRIAALSTELNVPNEGAGEELVRLLSQRADDIENGIVQQDALEALHPLREARIRQLQEHEDAQIEGPAPAPPTASDLADIEADQQSAPSFPAVSQATQVSQGPSPEQNRINQELQNAQIARQPGESDAEFTMRARQRQAIIDRGTQTAAAQPTPSAITDTDVRNNVERIVELSGLIQEVPGDSRGRTIMLDSIMVDDTLPPLTSSVRENVLRVRIDVLDSWIQDLGEVRAGRVERGEPLVDVVEFTSRLRSLKQLFEQEIE